MKKITRGLVAIASAAAVIGVGATAVHADVAPGTFGATYDDTFAKSGVHVQAGTPTCTVNADLSIVCSAYELGGVGNTNADAVLSATWTADVLCHNPAGSKNTNNDIEAQAAVLNAEVSQDNIRAKNGRMDVEAMPIAPSSSNPCPNQRWTAEYQNLVLVSFSYTLTFDGQGGAYITIAQP